MSLNRSSKWMDYPSQAARDQFVRTDRIRLRLCLRSLWLEDLPFPRRVQREPSDDYAAGEMPHKVKVLCTSLLPLQSRFARTHLQEHKTIRGPRLPQWQALNALHHALLCTELDTYLADVYRPSLPWYPGFTYIADMCKFTWPEKFHNMLALLQQQLPKSHCDILERFDGHPVARMTDYLTKDFAHFFETWIQRLEYLARYQPQEYLSGRTVPWNDILKMWSNEADGRDLNEPEDIIYPHKDLSGALLRAFCNATHRHYHFASMESSLAARIVDSATGEAVRVASDTIRNRPSDDLLTPRSLNSIGIVESDSEEWDQRRLAHWREHYGQGRSRTWRYRLYLKATKLQVTALAGKPRPCYLCVNFGPTARLPVTVDRHSNTLVTDWKLGKRRRTVERHHIDEALFSNGAHSSLPRAESNLYETQEFYSPRDDVDCSWSVSSLRYPERSLALPYENFVGAFLAPTYRVRRFLRYESHGNVYIVDNFLLPTEIFEAKIYNMKAHSRKAYEYRVRDLKHLRKRADHVHTVHQPGRKLVISFTEACHTEAWPLEEPRKAQSLPCAGSSEFEVAFPTLLRTRATTIPSTLEEAIMFYRLKALRAALTSCLGELKAPSGNGPNGINRHCTTPVRTYVEQYKAAEKTGMPIKQKTMHRMESKRCRQQAYRQKKQQRKNEHAELCK